MSTSLPSFVELMATLGLDHSTTPERSSSHHSSPCSSPKLLSVPTETSLTRSKSSHSLREQGISKNRNARYSPYAATFSSASARRSSFSSSSSSSPELERRSLRGYSTSPRPSSSPRLRRRPRNKLTVNVFDSTTDLASATTPISSFVRRKTPSASPTSTSFPIDIQDGSHSPLLSPMPLTLPTLPPFLPYSPGSDSFPTTPDSEMDDIEMHLKTDRELSGNEPVLPRRAVYRTGVRISTPPCSARLGETHNQPPMVHVA